MIKIVAVSREILLIRDGQRIASVQKSDVEDFTTSTTDGVGKINFETKDGDAVEFAFIEGEQFNNAIKDLILITNEMGI